MSLGRIDGSPIFVDPPVTEEVETVEARDYAQIAEGKVDYEFLVFILQTAAQESALAAA